MAGMADYDLIVLGGGLSGLTLVRQLLDQDPELKILLLEKRKHPVAEGAYKVGESTVEIGAHYLANDVRLKKHLVDEQLPKFGLRFFFNQGKASLAESLEVGTSEFFPAPGYQVDRGRLENYLVKAVTKSGAKFLSSARVKTVQLGSGAELHRVTYEHEQDTREVTSRWIVDASGRMAILKRQLNLGESIDHKVNAAWFRIGAELKIDEWCEDPEWRARVGKVPRRWLSTNHMLGEGYWVWIIPLPCNATSIGIVTDPRCHAISSLKNVDAAFHWLEKNEPLFYKVLGPHRDKVQDFLAAKSLGYSCRQVFSENRWALTGEAGVFLDPLYSPGIDYIAMGNTMISSLVAEDRQGNDIAERVDAYQNIFLQLFENNLLTYQDQYPVFGNPRVMSLKYVWDYAIYWSFPALLYFNSKLTDPAFVASLGPCVHQIREMNIRMQRFFRDWNKADSRGFESGVFIDQHQIGLLTRLNAELRDRLDDSDLRQRFLANVKMLGDLESEIYARVGRQHPDLVDQVAASDEQRLEQVFDTLSI